jgi:hypothetical protein
MGIYLMELVVLAVLGELGVVGTVEMVAMVETGLEMGLASPQQPPLANR